MLIPLKSSLQLVLMHLLPEAFTLVRVRMHIKTCFKLGNQLICAWQSDKLDSAAAVQARLSMLRALAALWGLSEEQVQHYSILNKPSLHISQAEVSIGRAVLPMLVSQSTQPGLITPANSNKVCQCLNV